MPKSNVRTGAVVGALVAFALSGAPPPAFAAALTDDRSISLGVRTYASARIGTSDTTHDVERDDLGTPNPNDDVRAQERISFPFSPAGHLRQNRFFAEVELQHDLTKLLRQGFGPLSLLNHLPFDVRRLRYQIIYRGEYDGIYDWGPEEYRARDSGPYTELFSDVNGVVNPPNTCTFESCPDVDKARKTLRDTAVSRHRLYQAFVDMDVGRLFLRIGRQNLVWGESDNFRLLDRINPVDSSFGGFLLALDERRVPIDMIRANYYLGELGDRLNEASLEGFVAFDNEVSYYPGVPDGSPWDLPNIGRPNGNPPGSTENFTLRPPMNFDSVRGGARFTANAPIGDEIEVTWSVAHYYTFADLPHVQSCVHPGQGFDGFPFRKLSSQDPILQGQFGGRIPGCPVGPTDLPISQPGVCTDPGADGAFGTGDDGPPGCRQVGQFALLAPTGFTVQTPAKIQVSGATATFALPARWSRKIGMSGEPIFRFELAYVKDEPGHTQRQLDPFVYHFVTDPDPPATGGILKRDSINFLLGIDTNQFIRFLNSRQSFFISTQFFYRHIKKAAEDEVLPVPSHIIQVRDPALWTPGKDDPRDVAPFFLLRDQGPLQPILVQNDADQFLQTLFIGTSYRSGTIEPSLTLFYDWSGAITYIPAVRFIHDPFRFVIEYSGIDAERLKGNSGVSLLRDRDNVRFQVEYVL